MIKSINLSKVIFYILLVLLLITYLFPGSLIGYFVFGDLGRHPSLADNPIYQPIPIKFYYIGDQINHFMFFLIITLFGFYIYLKDRKFKSLFYVILFSSVILELFHFFIPNRAFEIYDIFANLSGVMIAYLIIITYRFYNKNKT